MPDYNNDPTRSYSKCFVSRNVGGVKGKRQRLMCQTNLTIIFEVLYVVCLQKCAWSEKRRDNASIQ